MSKKRLNVYIEPDHGKRLDALAAMKKLSRSSIVARQRSTLSRGKWNRFMARFASAR